MAQSVGGIARIERSVRGLECGPGVPCVQRHRGRGAQQDAAAAAADLVYYEGGNQFNPVSIVENVPTGTAVRSAQAQRGASPSWLRAAARHSALMARIQAAIGLVASDLDGREWSKPDYRVVWPAGLDEFDPDLSHPRLPVNLNLIQRDLDRIRNDLASVGGELALSSFVWMVKDGMVLDPVRHRFTLEQLNAANYPFRYRELEQLARFQNRVFAKYAAVHGLPFVDVARQLPFNPDLFTDALHFSYSGTRLRAWVIFQELLPTIEKRLTSRSWPTRAAATEGSRLPTFTPRRITFDCKRAGPPS